MEKCTKMHEYLKKQVLPFTCFTHRSAYLSVLRVLLLPLLLFSDGKCIFSSFRVLKSSFCVLALADCSLLQRAYMRQIHVHQEMTRSHQRCHNLGRTAFWYAEQNRRGALSSV